MALPKNLPLSHEEKTGLAIAELLGIEPDVNGRYATSFGPKTLFGLGVSVRNAVDAHRPSYEESTQ